MLEARNDGSVACNTTTRELSLLQLILNKDLGSCSLTGCRAAQETVPSIWQEDIRHGTMNKCWRFCTLHTWINVGGVTIVVLFTHYEQNDVYWQSICSLCWRSAITGQWIKNILTYLLLTNGTFWLVSMLLNKKQYKYKVWPF